MYQTVFTEISNNVRVKVEPHYVEEESDSAASKHVYAYFITITNLGGEEVRLLSRHWIIEDSNYETFEVQGEGVVGRQPVIQPADSHTYNSFCVLKSYRGSMRGHYTMQGPEGTEFHVKIPQFRLHSHLLN